MGIRNVQKTGNMFYMYLPTSWCRKYKINSDSKVSTSVNHDGTLSVYPHITAKKEKHIKLKLSEHDQEIINKLIVACYINPMASFKIHLDRELDFSKLLDQKKLISVELVEFDGKNITCESSVTLNDPDALLRTMVTKVKNMLFIMLKNHNMELINRYEEEIDRSRLLIDKATISFLSFSGESKLKTIYIHYISLISKSLERMVDNLRLVNKTEKNFLESVLSTINELAKIIEKTNDLGDMGNIDYKTVSHFVKKVLKIQVHPIKNIETHKKRMIKDLLENISEVLMDWAITKEIEKAD